MTYDQLFSIWLENFRYECKIRGMDLNKLENETNLSKTNLCCYLTGSKRPSVKKLLKLCTQLNIPHQNIFFRENLPIH